MKERQVKKQIENRVIRQLSIVLLIITLPACRPQTAEPIVFGDSGVSLAPGDGWKRCWSNGVADASFGDVCLPVLEEEGVLNGANLSVMSIPTDRTTPEKRAARWKSYLFERPEVPRESFTQEEFTTDGGLRGIHISWTTNEKGPKVLKSRAHLYLFTNRRGCCVCVMYVVDAERDSQQVHEMIKRTLRLQ